MQERRINRKCQWMDTPWRVVADGDEACPANGVKWVSDTIPSIVLCPTHLRLYEERKMGTLVDLRRRLV